VSQIAFAGRIRRLHPPDGPPQWNPARGRSPAVRQSVRDRLRRLAGTSVDVIVVIVDVEDDADPAGQEQT
jgi:hypothetical protein